MSEQREMTLDEWCNKLPEFHLANRELSKLRARVAELEAERDDDDALRERMADILKRTAIALRGPEPPLTAWSWHDLPERAAAAIASIDLFQRVAHNLADPRVDVDAISDEALLGMAMVRGLKAGEMLSSGESSERTRIESERAALRAIFKDK